MEKNYITEVDILEESRNNFLTYSEEVLTDRAIPSIEDGLLSSHRKILWTMESVLKMNSKGNRKKCASIVGSTLSTAYFHGDAACYGALCKMSLDYLMRYPLISGQGSLGTQESNDMRASSRYTEAKPSIFADLMMKDFNKNIVPLKETYNGEYMEPVILPSAFPNAIVNGKEAIAIGISHSSLPHNLTETCDGIIAYLDNENLTLDELMEYIKGPDFPLGGTIINSKDIKEAYRTGKSKVSLKIRGDYVIKDRTITFTSIPYRTYRDKIKEQINDNIAEFDKVFDDFNDESSLGQNKLVFIVKKDADVQTALAKLFALTDLQSSVSLNMNYIVDGTPKLCSMLDMVKEYVKHQHNMLINAATYDRDKAKARAHILEGLIAAVDKINEVIAIIKASQNKVEAEQKLIEFLSIDKIQADAILDMKLGKLTRIDKEDLQKELQDKYNIIAECTKIIEKKSYRIKLLKVQMNDIKKKYGDTRRTKLENLELPKKTKEVIIEKEDVVVTLSSDGVISRTSVSAYNVGKKGRKGDKIKKSVDIAVKTNTVNTIGIFTNKGKMYKTTVAAIPTTNTLLSSLMTFAEDEKVLYLFELPENVALDGYVYFITKNGLIKKTSIQEYISLQNRKAGTIAIKLKENDSIISVTHSVTNDVMLITKNGFCIRVKGTDISESGRATVGQKGIALETGDEVISGIVLPCNTKSDLFIMSEDGTGRRLSIDNFTAQGKNGKGNRLTKEHLPIAGAALVNDDDTVLLNGYTASLCIKAADIPKLSKFGKGAILMKNNVKNILVL